MAEIVNFPQLERRVAIEETRSELKRLERLLQWQDSRLAEAEETRRSVENASARNREMVAALRERLVALEQVG